MAPSGTVPTAHRHPGPSQLSGQRSMASCAELQFVSYVRHASFPSYKFIRVNLCCSKCRNRSEWTTCRLDLIVALAIVFTLIVTVCRTG